MVSQPLGDACPVEHVHAPRQDATVLAGVVLRPADDARVPDKPGRKQPLVRRVPHGLHHLPPQAPSTHGRRAAAAAGERTGHRHEQKRAGYEHHGGGGEVERSPSEPFEENARARGRGSQINLNL